jgi:hypothetical protein
MEARQPERSEEDAPKAKRKISFNEDSEEINKRNIQTSTHAGITLGPKDDKGFNFSRSESGNEKKIPPSDDKPAYSFGNVLSTTSSFGFQSSKTDADASAKESAEKPHEEIKREI